MKRWALISAGALVALVAAFAAGRLTAPMQTVDRVVTVDREVVAHVAAYVGHVERYEVSSTRWKERIVYEPGKTVVEREQVQDVAKTEHVDERREESTLATTEKVRAEEHAPITSRPRFALEALAGATLDERKPIGGLGAQVRLGDWWLGAWGLATTDAKAVGASVRREF